MSLSLTFHRFAKSRSSDPLSQRRASTAIAIFQILFALLFLQIPNLSCQHTTRRAEPITIEDREDESSEDSAEELLTSPPPPPPSSSFYLPQRRQQAASTDCHRPFAATVAQEQQHSPGSVNESFFEQFIDSLDEINSYLESKLKRSSHQSSLSSLSSQSSGGQRRYQSSSSSAAANSDANINDQAENEDALPLRERDREATARDSISTRPDAPVVVRRSESSSFHSPSRFKETSSGGSSSRQSFKSQRRCDKRHLTQPINLEQARINYPNKTIQLVDDFDDLGDDEDDNVYATVSGPARVAGLRYDIWSCRKYQF